MNIDFKQHAKKQVLHSAVARGKVVIKGREDVAQAQNHAKQTDEILLGLLALKSVAVENRLQRELLAQLSKTLAVFPPQIFRVRLEQHNAAGLLVAKEANSVVNAILEIAEANDIAVGLHRIENAAGAA